MRQLPILIAAVTVAAVGFAPLALSQAAPARVNMARVAPAKAKAVMHQRHEGMEAVGKTMKQLARDIKADPLDPKAIKPAAARMASLAQKSARWFPAGTGPEAGKTASKAEIWKTPKDFEAKLVAWQKASAAFNAAAAGPNAVTTRAAFGNLGSSCKACHDLYRSKDKH